MIVQLSDFLTVLKDTYPKLDIQTAPTFDEKFKKCTSGLTRVILATLKPTISTQVQFILKTANQFRIPLYPISTGNNWGYGSAQPAVDNCVILDLSKMNKILSFDEGLGVVELEPGVTHADLLQYLKKHNSEFMVPVVGAGPNCSLIGNALERGFGPNLTVDHFSAVQDIKAVLADGSIYESAFSHHSKENCSKIYKWGIGPYIDGLFSQGNFGVVINMSIALAKKPESIEIFLLSSHTLDGLLCTIRELKKNMRSSLGIINLMHKHRVLATIENYPDQVQSDLEIALFRLADKHKLAEWNVIGAVYSPKIARKAFKKYIKHYLAPLPHKQFLFINSNQIKSLEALASIVPIKNLKKKLKALKLAFNLFHGIPSEQSLKLAYWRSKIKKDSDLNPAQDDCGLLWFAPIIPLKQEAADILITIINEVCRSYNIVPLISLSILSETYIDCTMPILFDVNEEIDVKNAHDCYKALFKACAEKGFFPYRMPHQFLELMLDGKASFWKTAERLKLALDPNNIVAPKRYSLI